MKRFLLITTCLLSATASYAQSAPAPSPAYSECTALATSNPPAALEKAESWLKIDGSIAAQHCRAMALYGLRRFDQAGEALSKVRDTISRENISMRSYIARQTAQAWINANQTDRALTLLSAQIDEMGNYRGDNATVAKLTADLLLDRGKLNANYGKMDDAAKDLDQAVSLTPLSETVLIERAMLFEKMGDKSLARSDAENVLKLNPKHAQARDLLARLGVMVPSVNLAAPAAPAALLAPATQGYTDEEPAPKKVYKRKKAVKPQAVVETPDMRAP